MFYRGSPYYNHKNSKNIDNELGLDREKLKSEFCRKRPKEAHLVLKYFQVQNNAISRSKIFPGSPHNAYKNTKNIDNKLGHPPLLFPKSLKT